MRYFPEQIRQGRSASRLTVSMTPMIDVVFLLLIFFLCTVTFQKPEQDLVANLLLPDGTSTTAVELPELEEINLVGKRDSGRIVWFINGGKKPYASSQLKQLFQSLVEIDGSLPVTIDPAESLSLDAVVSVYDLARAVGFNEVRLLADVMSSDPH